MSVIVMGMEMPENCYDCPFVRVSCGNDYYCAKGNGTEDNIRVLMSKRMDDCPLIEVPPHCRLIDADKIDYRNDAMHDGTGHLVVADNFMNGVMWINDCIDNTPTVIEAED